MRFAELVNMAMGSRLARWGGMRMSRRLRRSVPFIGTALALAAIGSTIRRKGVFGGSLDAGLNAMPLVGAAKNAFEMIRGRDIFPDRPPRANGR